MRSGARLFLALLLAAAGPAAAQPRSPAYDRAIAAGYKALTLCGAIFNAGRTQAQAEALELTGIYPEYDAIVPTLRAEVRTNAHGQEAPRLGWRGEVDVEFDPSLPPRIAGWLPQRGCTILPIGSTGGESAGTRWAVANSPELERGQDSAPWPLGDNDAATPRTNAIEARLTAAFDGNSYGRGRTTGVVIVQNGRIVGERYGQDFDMHTSQRTWSVAKSITGTLIGIAVRYRLLRTDQRAPIPEWRGDPRANIKLDDLLRMASGLHSATAGNRTDALYFGGTTVTQEVGYWPLEAPPGSRFRYANNDILFAVRALRAAVGDDNRYGDFPNIRLFAPLGMTRTIAEMDAGGNFILSSQVWSTARDLARLGLLWINDGVWQGRRILPDGWMHYMTTPSGPQPASGPGYGATIWLFGPAQGLPAGSYAAQGNRGQFVMVVPSRNLIVVRRGEDGGNMHFDIARFTADVMGALP
jgi:CubicO group peptidase (beta-lactamase class C family)